MVAKQKVRPIIGRVGGKVRLAPWIIEHLKRFHWSIYCEPFAGSGAVYFRMVQDGIFEQIRARKHHPRIVLNDADSRITQLFKTCRDHPELLAYAVAMTPYSREEHRLAQQGIDGIEDEIEQARRYLVNSYQSFKLNPGDSWRVDKESVRGCDGGTNTKDNTHTWHNLPQRILADSPHLQGDPNPIDSRHILNEAGRAFVEPSVDVRVEMARRYLVGNHFSLSHDGGWRFSKYDEDKKSGITTNSEQVKWQSLPDRILAATEHLKKCYIENDDAVKCIERWATPHTAIYADPPYVDCEDYYAHNAKAGKADSLEMHYRLAECLNTVEAAAVIVSYYPNDLVTKLYPENDWEYHYKDTVASSAGITRNSKSKKRPKRTELLLVRKRRNPEAKKINLGGQLSLF